MKKPNIIQQTWPFNCLTCRHEWESAYEAWHTDDGRGGQVITWRHKGTPSTPPWIEPACPACSSLNVKPFPPGTRTATTERDRPNPPATRSPATHPPAAHSPATHPPAGRPSPAEERATSGVKQRLAADPSTDIPPQRQGR